MKNIKRITKILGLCCAAAAGLLLVVLVASQLSVAVRMERFSQQLFDCPLPAQTVVLELYTVHDRLHTGNNERLEYTALMLVESQLTADELVAYYTPMVEAAWGPRPLFDPYFDDPGPVGLYIDPAEGASYQPEYNEQYPFYFESYPQGQDTAGLYYISIHY